MTNIRRDSKRRDSNNHNYIYVGLIILVCLAFGLGFGLYYGLKTSYNKVSPQVNSSSSSTGSSSSSTGSSNSSNYVPAVYNISSNYYFNHATEAWLNIPFVTTYNNLLMKNNSLFGQFFNNTAFTNQSIDTQITSYINNSYLGLGFNSTDIPITISKGSFSVIITGTLYPPIDGNYSFSCNIFNTTESSVFVWLNDNLVCSNNYADYFAYLLLQTMSLYATDQVSIRIEYIHMFGTQPGFVLKWNYPASSIPISNLFYNTSMKTVEVKREEMNYNQLHPLWSTSSNNEGLEYFYFPDGFGWVPLFVQISTQQIFSIIEIATLEPLPGNGEHPILIVTPQLHSLQTQGHNVFYAQMKLNFTNSSTIMTLYATMDYGATNAALLFYANMSQGNISDWFMIPQFRFYYDRQGICQTMNTSTSLIATCSPVQLTPTSFYSTGMNSNVYFNSTGILGITTNSSYSITQIIGYVNQVSTQLLTTYATLYPTATTEIKALIDLAGWVWLKTGASGMAMIVVRNGYNLGDAIFNWDSYFMSLSVGLTGNTIGGKEAMLKTLFTITKSKQFLSDGITYTPDYYVDGAFPSYYPWTQPCIGAKVLWELLQYYTISDPDIIWLSNFVFDDLYNNLNYLWVHRMNSNYLMAWMAGPESGMDNSNMYTNITTNTTTGVLNMYDVGLNALFISECQSLMKIIEYTGIAYQSNYYSVLQTRMQLVNQSMQLYLLYNGIYQNYYFQNYPSGYSSSYGLTSFFPLMTGLANLSVAESMITNYLLSHTYFNNQSYLFPTISANDPIYSTQNYWDGSIMSSSQMIMYWVLSSEYYSSSLVFQNALALFVNRSQALWLLEYELYGHLHEDYNSITGIGCDPQTSFSYPYHGWSMIFPLIGIHYKLGI